MPSGDDGVSSVREAVKWCRLAADHGTAVLYVTPHVNDDLPLSREREEAIRERLEQIQVAISAEAIELRLGFELHPTPSAFGEDPSRYRLEGFEAVLVECPLAGFSDLSLDAAIGLADYVAAHGLVPVLAHPERSPELVANLGRAHDLASRGWVLQVTGASLLGGYGKTVELLAWQLVEAGLAQVAASDGHGGRRPPVLDRAFEAAVHRIGRENALPLFDGRNLAELLPASVETT